MGTVERSKQNSGKTITDSVNKFIEHLLCLPLCKMLRKQHWPRIYSTLSALMQFTDCEKQGGTEEQARNVNSE